MKTPEQPPRWGSGPPFPRTGKKLSYLSVCSGIEAASVAWEPFGFQPVAFSEIEPFPSAVLARHYPDVPNMGDMTQYATWNIPAIDILAGGTPCQSFSVAGKRGGLSDERGNLCLTFCQMADHFDPAWVLWENVPGILSSVDNAFGCLLGKLCGFGSPVQPAAGRKHQPCGVVAGPRRTVAWRIMDAQWHGVPQRRRRVFVLASRGAGNWAAADALLPLGDRLPRHLEARRKARQKASSGSRTRPEGSHWDGGPHPTLGAIATGIGMSDQELFAQRGANLVPGISPTVTSKWAKGTGGPSGDECQNLVIQSLPGYVQTGDKSVLSTICFGLYENHPQDSRVTGPREVSPACTAQWGTGGGNTPLVLQSEAPETFLSQSSNTVQSCWCMPIDMRSLCRRDSAPNAGHGLGDDGDPSCTLTAQGHTPGVCYAIQGEMADGRRLSQNGLGISENLSYTLATSSPPAVSWTGAVRRLIPVECERLQGFPDGWTAIEKSPGKPYADSHRYKAVGNSMAVPVMCWLGRRILEVTADCELRQEEEDALRALQS
ncbi:DNA cytosine methyltransferase [Akkermansia sp. 54_46]|jgi:DNA (cytosine-5)-methyltransferase 1|uniref:DNA cytosine methyltransferase n=1 Tax=Akkermansia sp. 54_46 TaxID=1896967 RepID=UPI0009644160|nr:DNA cytosine methyltransferase [Akkermansia sp. 54_46]OLA87851.1 MAG: hypothetical protein BHW66_12700 [Akkermansia sp. 54_46]